MYLSLCKTQTNTDYGSINYVSYIPLTSTNLSSAFENELHEPVKTAFVRMIRLKPTVSFFSIKNPILALGQKRKRSKSVA